MNRRAFSQSHRLSCCRPLPGRIPSSMARLPLAMPGRCPLQHGDGQLFFPMVNNADVGDELVAARTDICAIVELRQNNRYDDAALASFVLEPKRPVPMRPTARHLRLVSLRQPLRLGERFTVVLDFLNAGEAAIEAIVEAKPGD